MGETTAGLVGGIPIIGHPAGARPAAVPRGDARVARRRTPARVGAQFLLAAGDITAEAVPVDLSKARPAARRSSAGTAATTSSPAATTTARTTATRTSTCRVGQWQGNDCFHDQFFPGDEPTYFTPRPAGPARPRARHLRQARQRQRRRRALAPSSSPGSAPSSPRTATSRRSCSATTRWSSRSRRSRSRRATRSTRAQVGDDPRRTTPRCRGCSCTTPGTRTATSARSARSRPRVTLQEIAAGKEYPGGFSLLRLHTGGFALNFYKTRSELARAWSERSRQEISGAGRSSRSAQCLRPQHHGGARPLGAAPRARVNGSRTRA